MVHLLGVNHSFQILAALPFRAGGLENAGSAHIAAALEAYVGEMVDEHRICTVAEEYSAECLYARLQIDENAYLVAKRVCEQRESLEHVFCDPDRAERESLYAAAGVSEAEDEKLGFPIREGEWLRRLQAHFPRGDLLFLCGAKHIPTFFQRLTEARIAAEVACEDFEARFMLSKSVSAGA